jgi:pimeloyl-ACP methyl ester carboxylesterase
MQDPAIRSEYIRGDGVDLHVVTGGEGPPVVLLQGFTENWRYWRRQIPAQVRTGF